MQFPVLALLAGLLLWPSIGVAEWVEARGEHLFGPDKSEAEACSEAERKAKEEALKSVSGERLSSEDLMSCTEAEDQASCQYNRVTWSMIDGAITGLRDKKIVTQIALGDFRKCVVTMGVEVTTAKGQPDPSFDMKVGLNASVYRDGDPLVVRIEPSQPMYLHVFQWLPYERKAPQVSRIFPNPFDLNNLAKEAITIPTSEGKTRYDMTIGFPEAIDKRLVDEYLLIVSTKAPVTFRETYSLEDFNARLLEIPRNKSRLIKRAYAVVRQ